MKVLILEDEMIAGKRLKKIIMELEPEAEVDGVLDSVESALNWFAKHKMPDLIFMDIQLADGLSFEVFKQVEVTAPVIFTTAFNEYTLKAFKVNSIDYLLKPIKIEELKQSLKKFHKLRSESKKTAIDYQALASALKNDQQVRPQRIVVKYGQNLEAIDIERAAYFYTEEKVVFLRTLDSKRYALDYNLEELEQMVDPMRFFRINRQFIVNVAAIDKMYHYSKSRVKISLKPPMSIETIVSTDRSGKFKKWLSGENNADFL